MRGRMRRPGPTIARRSWSPMHTLSCQIRSRGSNLQRAGRCQTHVLDVASSSACIAAHLSAESLRLQARRS